MKLFLNTNYKYLIILIITIFFLPINIVCAGPLDADTLSNMADQEEALADEAGFERSTKVGDIVAAIIKAALSLLGIIFIILIIIAGYNWMTAGGDEEKIRKAKDTLKRAIIGLLIIVTAYAITVFIFENLPGGGGGGSMTTS